MNPSLEAALQEAFTIAPVDVIVYHTIQVHQTNVQDPVYLVQSSRSLVALDENGIEREFEPASFVFSLPPQTEEGFQSLNLAIDNVNQRVVDFVKTAQQHRVPIQVIYRPYVSTDLSQPQMNPPLVLFLKDVSVALFQVTGRCTFMDIVNKRFPSELYTRARFPSLR